MDTLIESIRVIREIRNTCPYWVYGPECRMLTVIYGCGGYGEVSNNHPAASQQITEDVNGPYICGRCHGTGLIGGLNASPNQPRGT